MHIVETCDRPIVVISGGDEALVNNAYLQGIRFVRLWDGQVHIPPGLGHAPFREAPRTFDPQFERFLADVV